MKYDSATIEKAATELYHRRQKAEKEAESRRSNFIKEHPEYGEIEAKLSQTGLDAVKAIMGCNDPKAYIENLKKTNMSFREAKKSFLEANGFTEDYLEPKYTCAKCRDTGFVNGEMCECYKHLLREYAFGELSEKTPLQISSFDDFDVSLYKDESSRRKMAKIEKFCKQYADDFDTDSDSLFLYGETGLGKTHLSLAIAGKAIEKGFSVVYGSAHDFFGMIERERFGRSENPDGTTKDRLLECDLLILDDLGAEFITQFTVAELCSIINARLAKELPTIINSNLSLSELEKLYNSRITSRIIGSYKPIEFTGNDIRQIKK